MSTDPALAPKHRAMWASGDYPAVVTDLVAPLGPILIEATGIGPGDRVLDVAAGTGSVAIPAAQTGATVVASDLTPELLARGQAIAAERGVALEWREANAEDLPFGDNEFDAVVSSIGVMFAPHHQLAADELVRVLQPGGRIGVISWTPEGFIGQMFATMKPVRSRATAGCAAAAFVGQRGPCAGAARGTRGGIQHPSRHASRRPCRDRRRVPRLLQGQLRADDHGLPQHLG